MAFSADLARARPVSCTQSSLQPRSLRVKMQTELFNDRTSRREDSTSALVRKVRSPAGSFSFCKSLLSSQHRLSCIAWVGGNFAWKSSTHTVIARIGLDLLNHQHWEEIYKGSFHLTESHNKLSLSLPQSSKVRTVHHLEIHLPRCIPLPSLLRSQEQQQQLSSPPPSSLPPSNPASPPPHHLPIKPTLSIVTTCRPA